MMYFIYQITFVISITCLASVGANTNRVSACVPDTFYKLTSSCRDVYYNLSQTDFLSCDDVCKGNDMNCTAVNHGFNDTSVLKIFASVLGKPCTTSYDAYKKAGPAYNVRTRRPYCTKWKGIPDVINCRASPTNRDMLRLCPCINGSPPCNETFGMENGAIPDSNITASSVYSGKTHSVNNGRLHSKSRDGRSGAWSAAVNNQDQWLQVYFGSEKVMSGVATQGRNGHDQWVTSYSLSYSPDGVTFYGYHNNTTFSANQDRDSVVFHTLPVPIVGRYVRILPKTWKSHISMRAEFYGCERESAVWSPTPPNPSVNAIATGNVTTTETDHSSANSVVSSKELQFIFFLVAFAFFKYS